MPITDHPKESRTLGVTLRNKARTLKDKVFIYYKDETVTYRQLEATTNRIANTLINKFGVKKNDKIAVMLPNCPDYVFMQFGIPKTGAVQVPINTELTLDLLAYTINNCDAEVLIMDASFSLPVAVIADRLKNIKTILVRTNGSEKTTFNFGSSIEGLPYEVLLEGAEAEPPDVSVNWYDPVAIFYTSGTTGVSKGVVLPHNHHFDFPRTIAEWVRLGPSDIFYICLPFYHGLAQYMSVLPALVSDGGIAIAERFSASQFWSDVRKYKATAVFSVYTMTPILLKQPQKSDDADNPLRVYCTIGIAPSLVDTFEQRFGVNSLDMFGSTEQGAIAFTPYDRKKYAAVGPINTRDYEVKIVDEFDEELPPNTVGEYVSRAKKPFLRMMEYYKMPEETVKAFRNLWLHSGDLARIDEDGWIYFEGRAKDSIRKGGENISAFELEAVAGSYEHVEECAVVPVSSDLGEDEIKIYLVPIQKSSLDIRSFMAFCEEKMPKFMVPRYFEVIDSLPKTGTGKVEKAELKRRKLTGKTWDRVRNDFITQA